MKRSNNSPRVGYRMAADRRTERSSWLLISLVSTIVLVGCSSDESTPAPTAASPNHAILVTLSDEECVAYAHSMEAAIEEADVSTFSDAIDWNAIIDSATDGLGLPKQPRDAFRQGVIEGVGSQNGFAAAIAGPVAAGGSYEFIRAREMDGQKSVLFRMVSDAGVNYHEYLLAESDGRLMADDIYIYLSSERFSNTLRRSALPLAKEVSKTWPEKLTRAESDYLKHHEEFTAMIERLQQARYDEVLQIYARLPAVLQQDKNVLLIRYQAASSVGEQELVAAIEDFRRHHPSDVCVEFLLIDYYILKREYDDALASVDRLDLAVGGDPYLDALRANAVYQQGDVARAFALAENAISGAPEVVDAYWMLVGIALEEKDYDRVFAALQLIAEGFEMEWGDMSTIPEFFEFSKSPQGQEWARTHPQR